VRRLTTFLGVVLVLFLLHVVKTQREEIELLREYAGPAKLAEQIISVQQGNAKVLLQELDKTNQNFENLAQDQIYLMDQVSSLKGR